MRNPEQRRGRRATSWSRGASYPAVDVRAAITVAFDPQTGLPARVRTLDYDNIWGDVTYDLVLSDWRDCRAACKLAMNRKYELNGRVVQEMQVHRRAAQPAGRRRRGSTSRPSCARTRPKPATGNVPYQWVIRRQFIGTYLDSDTPSYDTRAHPSLRLKEIAPGVHHVVGGSHNSLIVEMSDSPRRVRRAGERRAVASG